MWRRLLTLFLAILILASSTTAYAAANDYTNGMANKLRRGMVDTLTGWVEFPAQIIKGYNEGFKGDETNKIGGTLVGIFDGIGHSIGRTLSGLTDLIGFWAVNPEDNIGVGIPLDAELAWQEGEPYNTCDPNFIDATVAPMGKKLMRGLGNGLFGILELPSQIFKGFSEGAYDLGIIKGFWFWYSREVEGLSDIATALFPGPKETMGKAFDKEWPWDMLLDQL